MRGVALPVASLECGTQTSRPASSPRNTQTGAHRTHPDAQLRTSISLHDHNWCGDATSDGEGGFVGTWAGMICAGRATPVVARELVWHVSPSVLSAVQRGLLGRQQPSTDSSVAVTRARRCAMRSEAGRPCSPRRTPSCDCCRGASLVAFPNIWGALTAEPRSTPQRASPATTSVRLTPVTASRQSLRTTRCDTKYSCVLPSQLWLACTGRPAVNTRGGCLSDTVV